MTLLSTPRSRFRAMGPLSRRLFRQAMAARLAALATASAAGLTRSSSNAAAAMPDFDDILSRPTWSVRSLLPSETTATKTKTEIATTSPDEPSSATPATQAGSGATITPSQLHHLLRLSALPLPASGDEENSMIRTLQSQLHFVRDIQGVDTSGVAPLQSIRDETAASRREQKIGLDQLKEELALERPFGRSRRPRRLKQEVAAQPVAHEPWDVLQTAPRRAGNYFIVKSRQKA